MQHECEKCGAYYETNCAFCARNERQLALGESAEQMAALLTWLADASIISDQRVLAAAMQVLTDYYELRAND